MSNTSKFIKAIVVLPTFGSPYLYKNKIYDTRTQKTELFKDCQDVVGGDVEQWEQFPERNFFIHPMFVREEKLWALADQIVKRKDVKIWVNENGMNECSPNMGCIVRHKDFSGLTVLSKEIMDALPMTIRSAPMFGSIAVVISLCDLHKVCNPDCLKLVEECYEPDDDADIEAKKKECEEKGWYWREGTGQIYRQKA